MEPTSVATGKIFIVGDNRSMPMEYHMFGETSTQNIIGTPVFENKRLPCINNMTAVNGGMIWEKPASQ